MIHYPPFEHILIFTGKRVLLLLILVVLKSGLLYAQKTQQINKPGEKLSNDFFGKTNVSAYKPSYLYEKVHQSPYWQAQWIWQYEDGPANTWACFRKSFSLNSVPDVAIARIAADSKYWLWINGQEVVFEGGLKRGPNPSDTYYDLVDLSDYLQQGHNVIAVQVWYFGKHGFSHHDSGKGGLLFECSFNDFIIKSDNSWKMITHPSYQPTVDPQPNVRLPESNVRFNAQLDVIGNWKEIAYDDSSWPTAVEKGIPPAAPWNALWERPIPLWKNSGLIDYERVLVNGIPVSLPFTTVARTLLTAELPYNMQVTPYLEIETTDPKEIFIYTDNYYSWRDKGVRAEYVAVPGNSKYESPGWMNGHKIIYSIPVGVNVKSLKYRETGYNTELSGSFVSNDNFFNTLWRKAQRTLYLSMRDNYMDCPDRERALWWGDAVIQLGKSFYALDRNADLLTKKAIDNLIQWQRYDDVLFSPVPTGNWNQELPSQMLASIGEFGFWNYFMYSGDTATITEVYPQVKKYLDVWTIGSNGLPEYRHGGWDWSDWGENIDAEALQHTWYYLALKAVKKMAVLSGYPNDTLLYNSRMKNLRNSFNQIYRVGNVYRSPSFTGQIDERVNAMAVLAGFAGMSQWEDIRSVLVSERNASPYMEKYVLEALFVMGYEHDAMARMKHPDRYLNMVQDSGSTLFEYFGNGGSNNHAWAGGPLTLLSKYCAGVAPVAPGFETYQVFPQIGDLSHLQTLVPSVKGDILVEIIKDTTKFSLQLLSPEKTNALVGIPVYPYGDRKVVMIKINDKMAWTNNSYVANDTLIEFVGVTDGYIVFNVQPGMYYFEAELEGLLSSLPRQRKAQNAFSCRLTPNPASHYLHVQFERMTNQLVEIYLYNLQGNLIRNYFTRNPEFTIDVGDLSTGAYILRIFDGQNSRFEHFIKQ